MDSLLILAILIVLFALVFDFSNGFHDTANTIATSISTRALSPRQAVILAGICNFIGALSFTGVAKTIGSGIVDPFNIQHGPIVILSALISAITWNVITWYFGIPSSSSHAIIGSLAGAVVAATGYGQLNYHGFLTIIEALVISPILAIITGFLIMTLFIIIFKNFPLAKTTRGFRLFQIVTAGLQSYTHGTNDAQKTMGIITLALISVHYHSTMDIPLWVRMLSAISMGLGTAIGGWRIIRTVGSRIMKIRPVSGAASDLASATIIFGFTALRLPVSSTHVISSSIIGVGSAKRIRDIRWGVARNIALTWLVTLPLTALFAAFIYMILSFFS